MANIRHLRRESDQCVRSIITINSGVIDRDEPRRCSLHVSRQTVPFRLRLTDGVVLRRPALVTGAVLLIALTLLTGCKPRNQFQPLPPPQVTIQAPVQRDVTEYLEETGQLAAPNSVDLVARVQGYLQAIGYRDGAYVTRGTTLFTIEPAPYAAQLAQAQANLASAQAKAIFGRRQFERYADLARTGDTSEMQAQRITSNHDVNDAGVQQAQAKLAQAATTLGYTNVTAPFDGIVMAHQANIGALVGGAQPTTLATIVQLDPVWANFNVSEQDVLRIRASMLTHGITFADLDHVPVEVGLQGESNYPHHGHIDYIASRLDPDTGTLAVRGILGNTDRVLLPGYFVHIRIPVGRLKSALLVPDSALGTEQGGRILYIVNANDVVEEHSVTIGTLDGGLRVITSGLRPDDRVVVLGLQRVQAGQKVAPIPVKSSGQDRRPAQ